MTRINIVPVEMLTDSHLRGEYNEITRPFSKMGRRIDKYGVEGALKGVIISDKYILNKGHESFFFDKLKWLFYRYQDLFREMRKRDYAVNYHLVDDVLTSVLTDFKDTPYWNDYKPTPEEMYLNMARMCKRSNIENVLEELGRG